MQTIFNLTASGPAFGKATFRRADDSIIAEQKLDAKGRAKVFGVPCAPGEKIAVSVERYGHTYGRDEITIAADSDDAIEVDDEQLRAAAHYRKIVQALAAGHGLDAEVIEAALEWAGRSEDELWVDVELERRHLAAEANARDLYTQAVDFIAGGGHVSQLPRSISEIVGAARKKSSDFFEDVSAAREIAESNARLGITN